MSEACLIQLQIVVTSNLTVTVRTKWDVTGGLLALLSAKPSVKVTAITIVIIIIFLTHRTCFLNEVVRFLKKSKVPWRPSHILHLLSLPCLVNCSTNDKLSPRMELRTAMIMKTFCHYWNHHHNCQAQTGLSKTTILPLLLKLYRVY